MKKWLAVVLVAGVLWVAQRTEHPAGFALASASHSHGAPFAIGIWYPTSDTPWPTTPFVMSSLEAL